MEEISQSSEEIKNNETESHKADYPSAELFMNACYADYQRVQDNYNKLYDKVYYALCLVGVVLTIMISTLDFNSITLPIANMTVGLAIITGIEILCMIGGLFLIFLATILLLLLLRGKKVTVFDSLQIRNNELYREKKEFAAVWLIGAYTDAVNEMKPVISKKQNSYDRALITLILGIVMYVIAALLQKGGF